MVALNDRIGSLPKEGAVLIVTSSYNGKPPSNAGQFVQWLEELKPDELKGVQYAVLVVEIIIGLVLISEFQDILMSKWLKKEQQDFLHVEKRMQVVISRNSSSNGTKNVV